MHGSVCFDFCWVCTQLWWQMFARAWLKSRRLRSSEVGLCLDRSCRCTVQGHRRLARVQAMCVHSCVSSPRASRPPSAPPAPAELAALFLRCRRPLGLQAPGRASWPGPP